MSEAEKNVEALRSVVEGVNQFSSTFFQSVVEHNPGNLITSPLSASIVLAMTAFGARGNTEVQFRSVLHLPTSESLATTGYQSLIDNLNNAKDNKLAVANKVFVAASLNLKPSYKNLTELYFRSSSQLVKFAQSQEAANIINGWVEQNTNNLIKKVITADMLNDMTKLVLVNAVYFKGQWKDKFDPKLIRAMPFHTSKVEEKCVPTMRRQGKYKYGDLPDLNATFVVIPYKGDELSMVIILPNEIDGLSDVQKKLQNTSLTDVLRQGHEEEMKLWLPMFKVESNIDLGNVLIEMGLIDAFAGADFSGIADGEGLYINHVIQKAYIEVNTEGSEAVGVTLIRSFWLVALALITMSEAEKNVEALRSVVEGANQFSSSFFQTVVQHNPGNLIMSPLSASIVLAMTAFGARGNTEAQFRNVLHLPTSESLATTGYQSLIDNLKNVKNNKLAVANKVFVAASLNLKPSYKNLTELYFRSSSQLVKFAQSQKAANIINGWVEQNTNSLIKELITAEMLDDTTRLVLVNAIYFKGQWKDKFDPTLTSDMPFHTSKVEVKNVPTMYRQGKYKYGELPDLNATFVVIPYKGDELSMVIILPNEIDGLSDVQKKLQNTSLTNIISEGYGQKMELWLPKFKVESKIDLRNILIEMGLTDAFVGADFSGIADGEGLNISHVIQKAYIEVNEEGSEAAAATEMVMMLKAVRNIGEFKINQPFLYYIIKTMKDEKENDINLPLFCGSVIEPKI